MNVKFGCRQVLRFGGVGKSECTWSELCMSELPMCMRSAAGLATSATGAVTLGVGSPRRLEHNSSCIVLYSLQFLDSAGRCAVKHSIAVVDPGQNRADMYLSTVKWK